MLIEILRSFEEAPSLGGLLPDDEERVFARFECSYWGVVLILVLSVEVDVAIGVLYRSADSNPWAFMCAYKSLLAKIFYAIRYTIVSVGSICCQ